MPTRLELTLGGGEPATAAIAVTRVRPMLMSFPGDCFVLFSPTYSEKETRAIFAGASLLRFETYACPQSPLKANSPTPTADPCPLRRRWPWLTVCLRCSLAARCEPAWQRLERGLTSAFLEQAALIWRRCWNVQVFIGFGRRDAPAGRASQETLLEQIRFVNVLNRVTGLG